MSKSEQTLFVFLMMLFFAVSILLILVPKWAFKIYSLFIGLFGFKVSYSVKAFNIGRIFGALLLLWGIFIIFMSKR